MWLKKLRNFWLHEFISVAQFDSSEAWQGLTSQGGFQSIMVELKVEAFLGLAVA